MNLTTEQIKGKTQWGWSGSYGGRRFSYHTIDGLALLYYLDNPNIVIVHQEHTVPCTYQRCTDFIHEAFEVIDAHVEIENIESWRFMAEHKYIDFNFKVKVTE